MSEHFDKWISFLKPENLKGNLISCALYIATFESFKDYVTEEVKFFFHTGFGPEGDRFSENYKKKVLAKNKSPVTASLLFLKDLEAINEEDIELFNKLRVYRNTLAHKMIDFVYEGVFDIYWDNLYGLMNLRIKIEKWWILNIDIPTGGNFKATDNTTEDDIQTGSQIFNKLLLDILMGDDETAKYYHDEFKKKKNEMGDNL